MMWLAELSKVRGEEVVGSFCSSFLATRHRRRGEERRGEERRGRAAKEGGRGRGEAMHRGPSSFSTTPRAYTRLARQRR